MTRKAIASRAVQRVDQAAACLLPVATTMLAMVVSLQPIHVPGYAALAPAFTLMAVYHWTIYRPELLPSAALFLIGVTQDLLAGAPPGATALLLLLARAGVLAHRHQFVNRPFPFVWAGFTVLAFGAMLLLWALNSLLDAVFLDPRVTVFRAVLTTSLFPVASFLLGRTQRALMGGG
jgi:rod shape-determining protein MreD